MESPSLRLNLLCLGRKTVKGSTSLENLGKKHENPLASHNGGTIEYGSAPTSHGGNWNN